MEQWQFAVILLVGVLVGALIPALFELASTLRGLKRLLKTVDELVVATRPGVEKALLEIGTGAAHLNRAAGVLERSEDGIKSVLEAVEGLKTWVARLRNGATILAMVVGAVLPGVLEAVRRAQQSAETDLTPTRHVEKEMES